MMRLLLCVPLLLWCVSGCNLILSMKGTPGSGVIVSESRDVVDFEKVKLTGALDVEYFSADAYNCEIEVDDNLQEFVTAVVDGGILQISITESVRPTDSVKVRITSPTLSEVGLSGACDLTAKDIVNDSFTLKISGAADVVLTGQVEKMTISLSGAGDVDATGMVAQDVNVGISGAGDVQVTAERSLNVGISGSGNVRYQGNAEVSKKISGAGSVTKTGSDR